jgi:hypothetical protein
MKGVVGRLGFHRACATLPAQAFAAKWIDEGLILKVLGEQIGV